LLAAICFGFVAASSAAAATPAQDCRSVAAKEGRKFFGSAYKARQKCLDGIAKGTLSGGTDCATETKTALKISKSEARLDQRIRGECTDLEVAGGSYADACSSAATVDDLVSCIRGSHAAVIVSLLPDLGGVNLVGETAAQKCRKIAGKGFRKVADRRMKESQKCQDAVDDGGLPAETNCIVRTEADDKIARLDDKNEKKLVKACGGGASSPLATAEFPVPCDTEYSSRFYSCVRCNMSTFTNGLLQSQGVFEDSLVGLEPVTGACIPRTTTGVALDDELTFSDFGGTWEMDFYRNTAYACGLSGNYTFMVIDPINNPGAEAPLWVYLHGGGIGYYDDQQEYHATLNQTEDTWNHEETFTDLQDILLARILDNNDQPEDQTIVRRMQEGYRLLVVSMCDHDLYSGIGTPYTNNPNGGQVNGLQATMAAIDYTAANYPTTHVFAHGTSAGSAGVFSAAIGYALEGAPLTGIVPDSTIASPRLATIVDAFAGVPGFPMQDPDFDSTGATEKIGVLADPTVSAYPEAVIAAGFTDVPSLFIGGSLDPFCAGNQTPLPEAAAEGFTSNCDWFFDGVAQVVAAQPNSPHEVHVFPNEGHVPTNDPSPANDVVDDFIGKVLATNPPPFGD
jgi:hypothetical protein